MEKKLLHLLIVDDSPDDADQVLGALRRTGYVLKSQRVQDMTGMQAALQKGEWEVVLAKHVLPHFGASLVLDTLKHAQRALPLIVLADRITDEDIAKLMHAGARDVVRKHDLGRLAPAIERELALAQERTQYRTASERLNEIERKHQAMIDGSREAICYSHDGMHVDVNRAYLNLFGYESLQELEGVPLLDLIDAPDHARFKELLRKGGKKGAREIEPQRFTALCKDGSKLPIEVSLSLINLGGEECMQIIVSDVSQRPEPLPEMENAGELDALTGTYQKDYFLRELGKAVEQAKNDAGRTALAYLELDGLKEANERLGKDAGDRFLRDVADRFRRTFGDSALLSRFGGNEFALLLRGVAPLEMQQLANRLRQCVADAASAVGTPPAAAACALGQIMIDRTAGSVEQVLSWVYSASEQARKQKKVPAASPATRENAGSMPDAESVRLGQWRERIQRALERDAFQLAYQPVINLVGDPSEYFEVLIRLPGDDGQLIPAAEFMSTAEQSGLAHAMDHWVIEHALSGLVDLHKESPHATFFLNVSPQTLLDEGTPPAIQKLLKENGLQGKHLVLETDESVLDKHPKETAAFIKAVTKIGCRISLDNFGGRLSGLDRVRDLPIEFVKIDGSLARAAAHDNVKQLLLKTIVQIAKMLRKKTIGKYVEDEETLSLLYSYELDYLQGNYFQHADARPEYAFAGETTLSSETETPGWPPSS